MLQYNTIAWMCIASFDTIPSFLHVHLTTLEHSIYVARHREKRLLYVLTGSGGRFQEPCPVKFGKVPTFLRCHGTFRLTVCFVADDGVHSPLRLNMQLSLRQPALKMLKAASICYVIHDQNTD